MEKNTPPSTPRSVASSTTAGDARPFPDEQVHALARSYSRHSQKNTIDHSAVPRSPFDNAGGTQLDPSSPNFSARAWTETMMKLQTEDPNNPTRRAGLSFRNLSASGHGSSSDFQNTFSTTPMKLAGMLSGKGQRIDILHDMDGLVRSGEMLGVLGPPGSGCSTFLKTISGETAGFEANGELNYEGISAKQMHHDFRGESIYTAEVDVHFPALSVGDTLYFAARARAPRHTPGGVSHHDYAEHVRDVTMAILGISHTINTNVGDDFVRGVSGGERKRVTIAEALLAGAPLQTWDNSTRGLDSATALEFCRSLKLSTSISGKTACVSLYQAPQSAYDVFDKVMVLYEGRQIYFGRTTDAKKSFTDMGFLCPERQTTADFLTSLTSDLERKTQPGFEHLTPRTPDKFVRSWKESAEYKALLAEIDEYNQTFKIGGERLDMFIASRKAQQWKGQRTALPYTLSYRKQIELCVWRGFRRLVQDPQVTATQIIGNSVVAVIISSIIYNLRPMTDSFFQRGALMFFSILMAAFASMLEMFTLYAQRNIVEKHTRYAFYHPSAEAFASMLCDIPYKVLNCIFFSLVIYFMSNLRREVGLFFFFTFVSFLVTMAMAMSMMFCTIASASRSILQALAPSAVLIFLLCIYTGFAIPIRDMRAYFGWMRFLNPIFWAFEALMVNEFQGRIFPCTTYVPMGEGYEPTSGLDSQTSWAICDLLAKLTAHGQAILCTIHQPSAMLFQRFDRLLFLAKGGRTVYFGEVGEGSHILTKYFEKNGAHPCPANANPAEWMLEVIGAAPGSHTEINWHQTWLESPERVAVKDELHRMEAERGGNKSEKQLIAAEAEHEGAIAISEFAAPFSVQYREVQKRVFQQYWRTPSYLYSKLFLLTASALFIGFSFFKVNRSRQGLQNQMFSLFMPMVIFGDIVFQILPSFVGQRSLYEARERPSKTYSWKVFMLSNIVVEIPFNAVCALVVFVCYFWPVGLWRNAEPTGAVHERGALFFLLLQQFLLFASTFGHMIVSGIDSAETASNIGNLLFILCLIFCGVLANPSTLPRFWIFMYRVSPFTYLIEGMLTTAVANTNVVCSDIELLHFLPPVGEMCGAYMSNYISTNGGYLIDEAATSACEFCNLADTNVFLASVSYDYANRWRDFGLMWVYIAFNVAAATAIYYIARVPKKQKQEKIKKE